MMLVSERIVSLIESMQYDEVGLADLVVSIMCDR